MRPRRREAVSGLLSQTGWRTSSTASTAYLINRPIADRAAIVGAKRLLPLIQMFGVPPFRRFRRNQFVGHRAKGRFSSFGLFRLALFGNGVFAPFDHLSGIGRLVARFAQANHFAGAKSHFRNLAGEGEAKNPLFRAAIRYDQPKPGAIAMPSRLRRGNLSCCQFSSHRAAPQIVLVLQLVLQSDTDYSGQERTAKDKTALNCL
jgi:hypothetical protein